MQTIFLVWFPGLAALLVGASIACWVAIKAARQLQLLRRDRRNDQLLIETTGILKAVCGDLELNGVISPDLQDTVNRQIFEVEAVTRKQL